MTRMSELERALAEAPLPDEQGAERRAWAAVLSAHRERARPTRRPRPGWRLAIAPAAAITAAALALSPAGATVGRLIGHALGTARPMAVRASLPGGGILLASGAGGTFTVSRDGGVRRLGPWRQAQWSPHGLYVSAAGRGGLAVVDPRGAPAWALSWPVASDPRWYEPTGYRLAYMAGPELRVVAGDGSGDHPLAAPVAAVAPAWRPGHPYQLAYLTPDGRLLVRGADSGRLVWRAPARARAPVALAWSPDGARLLLTSRAGAWLYGNGGRLIGRVALGAGAVLTAVASPDGRTLALVLAQAAGHAASLPFGVPSPLRASAAPDELELLDLSLPRPRVRARLALASPASVDWSPDGRWLLLDRGGRDGWLLVRPGPPATESLVLARVQRRLARLRAARVEGWCCQR